MLILLYLTLCWLFGVPWYVYAAGIALWLLIEFTTLLALVIELRKEVRSRT